jgi:hypothetical protein
MQHWTLIVRAASEASFGMAISSVPIVVLKSDAALSVSRFLRNAEHSCHNGHLLLARSATDWNRFHESRDTRNAANQDVGGHEEVKPMRHGFVTIMLLVILLGGGALFAHPGHDDTGMRVWKAADELFDIEASFVLARDDQVQLCKHDGSTIWIPLDGMSQIDREWVERRIDAIRRLNRSDSPPEPRTRTAANPESTSRRPTSSVPTVVAMLVMITLVIAIHLHAKSVTRLAVAGASLGLGSLCVIAGEADDPKPPPAIQKHFEAFRNKLELRSDDDYLYVGSNGFPDHPMMVGIKAWQQQVPLPQPYTGRNAWRIPLHPKLADKPISAKTALFRGAITLAVNGVPIFNALNNRGDDAFLTGELDEYGGHCGRGDDYHYHIAPVHLEKIAGRGNPIAYALDGYPLFGYHDADGKEPRDLDAFNGRMETTGYRYYSTRKYPYINGGMRGVVTVRGDQIEPQPRDAPVRPAGRPLRGATITAFTRDDDTKTFTLKYDLQGKPHSVKYTVNKDGTYAFAFTDGAGKVTTETYRRREGRDRPPP